MSFGVGPASRQSRLVQAITPRFFYGWVIVAVGFIAQMFTSLANQGLSTYMAPLRGEFGWSAAEAATGRSFQQVDAFLGPASGWLLDRFGPRRVMSAGVVLYAGSFVVFSQVDTLWAYYGACLLMGVSNSLVGLLVVSFSLNQWFRRRRTTAIGIAVTGLAAAGALFIPLIVQAQAYGWRTAAFGTAIGMLLLGLPIFLLMRDAPEPYGLLPDGDPPRQGRPGGRAHTRGGGLVSFTVLQALRTRAFWLITLAVALSNLAQAAVIVHQFPHLEAVLDRSTAAFVLSVLNVFNLAGRLIGGVLGDRLRKHLLLGIDLLGTTAALMLLAFAVSLPPLLVYGALFGLSWGIRTAVANSLQGDYFGRAAFGRIVGLTQMLASPAAIAAPIVVGVATDAFGGYQAPFLLLAGVAATSSALFFLARRPADPRPRRVEGQVAARHGVVGRDAAD